MDNNASGCFETGRVKEMIFFQKRLRHLRSIAVRNIRFADVSTEAGKLETFFSLHNGKTKKGLVNHSFERVFSHIWTPVSQQKSGTRRWMLLRWGREGGNSFVVEI